MSKVGKDIIKFPEKILRKTRDIILGDSPDVNTSQDEVADTAQEAADKAQGTANEAIARRKKRSLLSSGADSGAANNTAKKLLGE